MLREVCSLSRAVLSVISPHTQTCIPRPVNHSAVFYLAWSTSSMSEHRLACYATTSNRYSPFLWFTFMSLWLWGICLALLLRVETHLMGFRWANVSTNSLWQVENKIITILSLPSLPLIINNHSDCDTGRILWLESPVKGHLIFLFWFRWDLSNFSQSGENVSCLKQPQCQTTRCPHLPRNYEFLQMGFSLINLGKVLGKLEQVGDSTSWVTNLLDEP